MAEIEWAMWANEQALISAFLILIGGIVSIASFFKYWQFAAAGLAASVLVLIIEYPRGRRQKGTTMERRFQRILMPIVSGLAPVTTNYYVRGFTHLIIGVPCCFLLPTIIGGLCLMLSGIIYIVAAAKGEMWKPIGGAGPRNQPAAIVTSEPPSRPPPRLKAAQVPSQDPDYRY